MHGNLTPERYEEIEEEVINMLEDCEVTQYPINPIHLAIKLRYVLRPYSLLSYKERQRAFRESKDGFSQLEEDRNGMVRFVIYYNDLSKYKGGSAGRSFMRLAIATLGIIACSTLIKK